MFNLLIADDEPKIRRGITGLIDYSKYGINKIYEAEDGEIALNIIKDNVINILLLDINMPFINGIELLKMIYKQNKDIKIIIISGYDEFSYAQEALKYNVKEYILKPIKKQDLEEALIKVIDEINESIKQNNYMKWAINQVSYNLSYITTTMFGRWMSGIISDKEVIEDLEFFKKRFSEKIGLICIKITDKYSMDLIKKKWDSHLINFAIENIIEEDFRNTNNKCICVDDYNNIIIICDIDDIYGWIIYGESIRKKITSYLKINIIIEQGHSNNGIVGIKNVYIDILNKLKEKKKYSRIVIQTINYLNSNYYCNNINVNDIASNYEVTSSYLSKLLKKETGMSFVEYLTQIRLEKSMELLKDPSIKIYDVAELVGYSDQHYFCRAFKKVTGISPTEYKRRGENE